MDEKTGDEKISFRQHPNNVIRPKQWAYTYCKLKIPVYKSMELR